MELKDKGNKYIIVTKSNFATMLIETYKIIGILLIIGVNHLKLDDSFFGAIATTILFVITFNSIKPVVHKEIKTIQGKKNLKKYFKEYLNKQENE